MLIFVAPTGHFTKTQDIGDTDTLIAATALEQHPIILTIDCDYERVPGLTYVMVNQKKEA